MIKKNQSKEYLKSMYSFLGIFIVVVFCVIFTYWIERYAIFFSTLVVAISLLLLIITTYIHYHYPRYQNINGMVFVVILIMTWYVSFKAYHIIKNNQLQAQPKQKMCGKLSYTTQKQIGQSKVEYWMIVNKERSIMIARPNLNESIYIGDSLCLEYAIDERWQDTPKIYAIHKK